MFPGAVASRTDADYAILGAPLDASTSFEPGARFGPDRVRHYARGFEDFDHHTGRSFTDLAVYDDGDAGPTADVADYLEYLRTTLEAFSDDGALPLLLGGEHTVSLGGVRATDPDVFVALDAHLDLRAELGGDPLSHATVTRHALDVADEAVILGARAGSEAEWDRASQRDVTVVEPDGVADWTPDFGDADVYLSVDIDAFDPAFAPGTGTKEPFGLDPATGHRVVRELAPESVGFDVVEVNDRDDGQAATLAAKLLRAFVFAHAAGR
jgi:agmatinase